jgi:hypothetical protein
LNAVTSSLPAFTANSQRPSGLSSSEFCDPNGSGGTLTPTPEPSPPVSNAAISFSVPSDARWYAITWLPEVLLVITYTAPELSGAELLANTGTVPTFAIIKNIKTANSLRNMGFSPKLNGCTYFYPLNFDHHNHLPLPFHLQKNSNRLVCLTQKEDHFFEWSSPVEQVFLLRSYLKFI